MRRQKYFFDFKFGISVKFRVEWCISPYDSYSNYQFSLYFVYLHAYAITISGKNLGKFKMNYMKIYTIRRGILRWFRIWSQKNIFAYAFTRKSRLKKFAWANSKKFYFAEFAVKFWFKIYPYVTKSKIINPRIADVLKIEFYRLL